MGLSHDIGSALKEVRKARGFTQAELAEAVGRTTDALSQIERGVSVPTVDTLILLASKLCISLDQLVGSDDGVSQARRNRLAVANALLADLSDAELEIVIRQISAFRAPDL